VFGIDRDSESSPLDDDLNNPIRNVALTTNIHGTRATEKHPGKPADPD